MGSYMKGVERDANQLVWPKFFGLQDRVTRAAREENT